jgi:SpoIID/LytB domain protein
MTKRASALLAVMLAVVLLSGVLVSRAEAQELEVEFVGGGWGHGVGLSQFGAYGMALEGASAQEIITHYYQSSTVGAIPPDTVDDWIAIEEKPLWVGLFQKEATVTFKPVGGPATLCYGGNGEPNCDLEAQDGEIWQFQYFSGGCELARKSPDGKYVGQTGVLPCGGSVTPVSAGIAIDMVNISTQYKNGILRVRRPPTAIGLHAVWQTGIEDYVRGIAEMPDSWGDVAQAALEAQAIIARTYAINRAGARTRSPDSRPPLFTPQREDSCWCNLFDDTRDQVFWGWTGESQKPNSALAATATAGQVVLFEGSTAQTYYFSSSFGFTENSEDVFVQTLPYLRSVDDHWAVSEAVNNANADWTARFTLSDVTTRLGWTRVDTVVLASPAPAAQVRVSGLGADGNPQTQTYRGGDLRSPLSLLSPQITAINGIPPFTDIVGSPHTQNIITIWLNGVTQGCTVTQYCPNAPVTRGQMASFLARALDLPPASTDFFPDDNGSTHEDNINRVREAGIAQGFEDGTYRPAAPVRRDHMATFLARASALEPVPGPLFTDVSGFHEGNINAIAAAGITLGCSLDGPRYCPADLVTRAQMASFLARAFFSG